MLGKTISSLVAVGLLLSTNTAFAQPERTNFNLDTTGTERVLILPDAADHSPVISLGSAIDSASGEVVSGYAIVHYRKAFAKGGGGKGGAGACYAYMASGAKWKEVEPWLMNPANSFGLDETAVFTTQAMDVAKWEDSADGIMGNGLGTDIIGAGSATGSSLVADMSAPDGDNEVYFGSVSEPNAIAVTVVWGVFSGPPTARKLVEWDQVFNTEYGWSLSGEAGEMDFENISTHELGHTMGMADLYTSDCVNETMYGYADYGQTNKRDLHTGDILGMNKLY